MRLYIVTMTEMALGRQKPRCSSFMVHAKSAEAALGILRNHQDNNPRRSYSKPRLLNGAGCWFMHSWVDHSAKKEA